MAAASWIVMLQPTIIAAPATARFRHVHRATW
jgi:hypothetical protein